MARQHFRGVLLVLAAVFALPACSSDESSNLTGIELDKDDGGNVDTGAGGSGGTESGAGGGAAGASGADAGVDADLTCLQHIAALGVQFENTKAKGVVDAVHITDGMINGVMFAVENTDEPIEDPIACLFVLRLWQYAEVLKAHDIYKIGTLGSYCYRCCCQWSETNYCRGPDDPEPDCSQNGYSTHAWGRAIDTEYFYKNGGEVYDINNPEHWVEWTGSGSTCTAALAAQTGISKELYTIVCELRTKHVFGTIYTPNHNTAHRNHTHSDIGASGEPGTFTVDSLVCKVDEGPGDE